MGDEGENHIGSKFWLALAKPEILMQERRNLARLKLYITTE